MKLKALTVAVAVAVGTALSPVWPARWPPAAEAAILGFLGFLASALPEIKRSSSRRPFGRRLKPAPELNEAVLLSSLGLLPSALPDIKRNNSQKPSLPRLKPAPELKMVPQKQPTFCGRQDVIKQLMKRLAPPTSLASNRSRQAAGPTVVLMHGMPGVGKTALAHELARQVRTEWLGVYSRVLYADLGNVPAPDTGDVLNGFLRDLGHTEPLPERQTERGGLYRTYASDGGILLVLDGARDYKQVRELLPNGPNCAAIVTSRRSLQAKGVLSELIPVLSQDDAIDMFYAMSSLDPHSSTPSVAKIVEFCGRLPLAIQSAAERISLQGGTAIGVHDLLADEQDRLDRLGRKRAPVDAGFAEEYEALDDRDRLSLCLLSHVASPTFTPWVLCALRPQRLGLDEAEDVFDRLHQAQLIEYVSQDSATELHRYRFHPLVRLFVAARLDDEGYENEAAAARERLDQAYSELVEAALCYRDPRFQPRTARERTVYLNKDTKLWERTKAQFDEWLHAEYAEIVRCVRNANGNFEHGLCWRIGASLDGLIPEGGVDEALEVHEIAVRAADHAGEAFAQIDTRIAKAASLMSIERYEEAEQTLTHAWDLASQAEVADEENAMTTELNLRRGRIHMKRGEASVQMRRPLDANRSLSQASKLLRKTPAKPEIGMITLMTALINDVDVPDTESYKSLAQDVGPVDEFWVAIEYFEERRRRGKQAPALQDASWEAARDYLAKAEGLTFGDSRRQANVLYRRARLYQDEYNAAKRIRNGELAPEDEVLIERSIRRATDAFLRFERMDNPAGMVRACYLLIRAMVDAKRLRAADQEIKRAVGDLESRQSDIGVAHDPLLARITLARALWHQAKSEEEANREGGAARTAAHEQQADDLLVKASRLFDKIHDGHSVDEAKRIGEEWDKRRTQKVPNRR